MVLWKKKNKKQNQFMLSVGRQFVSLSISYLFKHVILLNHSFYEILTAANDFGWTNSQLSSFFVVCHCATLP